MKKAFGFLLLVLFLVAAVYVYNYSEKKAKDASLSQTPTPLLSTIPNAAVSQSDSPRVSVIAEGLDTPWAIAMLPDNSMLVTERLGTVRLVNSQGKLESEPVAVLRKVKEIGEGGLLGLALHPQYSVNNFVYLYYTYSSNGDNTLNRVVRMTYKDKKLQDEMILVDGIPGAANHNGGRIKFGPDGFLYITTGDAQAPSQAQDTNSLAGKILRVTDEGKPAPGNPFGNAVYSYGHRNPQGLAWDSNGNLWETEHGRSGLQSGLDEINMIEVGKNYGWPTIQGDETRPGMETPRVNSGNLTWAPGDAAFTNGVLYFVGLRGTALYEANILSGQVTVKEHLKDEFGRLREVVVGPEGLLYITTSNQDGRGLPAGSDDRILKLNPLKL